MGLSDFEARLKAFASGFELVLSEVLEPDALAGPGEAPGRLVAAMRHGALGGGKRLRPFLLFETAATLGAEIALCRTPALAVEMVHSYSLVHDDLPSMDDDVLRRGQPTVHKAFDEATAILAGDALLTESFRVVAQDETLAPGVRTSLIIELATGAGAAGMAGGQMLDLLGEKSAYGERAIAQMQAMKTGALIRAAVRMGALIGGASTVQMGALTAYAEAAGRAFQLADDLLDLTATPDQMGKATGKDAEHSKATIVALIGIEAAERQLGEVIHDAISALAAFGAEADGLRELARFFAARMR